MTQEKKKIAQAAQLVAEDELTDEQIAEKLEISRSTLARWKRNEKFQARVAKIADHFAERALQHGIARKEKRVGVLAEVESKLRTVIAERAVDPELQTVAGGKTGLITKTVKGIGKGDDYQVVEVYEVDTAVLKEIRAIHEQVAEELGQRVKKHEMSGKDGGPITLQMIDECLADPGTTS